MQARIAVPIESGGGDIPAKVQAAQQFMYFAQGIRCPQDPFPTSGDTPKSGGELTAREQAAYDAATDVLVQYFRGEMDYGDPNPGIAIDEGPDDPQQPVLVS